MSASAADISWQVLRRIVREWHGTAAELAEVTSLHGGSINTTLALRLSNDAKVVCKISPHRVDRSYEHEAHQLRLMKGLGLPVPDVYCVKTGTLDEPFSYILIEFIEGIDLNAARRACAPEAFERLQERLADVVATMHDHRAERYGRVTVDADDAAGAGGGGATSYASWPAFYREVYDPIWHEADKAKLLTPKCRKQIGRVHEKLERLIAHNDCPRLSHGDLWSTNLLVKSDAAGEWHVSGLLDPNCKFAHAEAEVAYLELFHTVTPTFLKAYQRRHKLPPEYHRFRKPVYQLYSLLDHLNLFGQEYHRHVLAAVERVSSIA
jgi:fructosamine-3-kinase